MGESLMQFRQRIYSFEPDSLPCDGDFVTSPGLVNKVDGSGTMKPFFGNTIVFLLKETERQFLVSLQQELYGECSKILAAPLWTDSFHMTLHDLINGVEQKKVGEMTAICRFPAFEALGQAMRQFTTPIFMRPTWIFNMVNTSVVMGLEPEDEVSFQQLAAMYELFQGVVALPYPFTPHITLAYYKPGRYDCECLKDLRKAFQKLNERTWPAMCLEMFQLVYQEFSDMNHYSSL